MFMNLIAVISAGQLTQWEKCKTSNCFGVLEKSLQRWVNQIDQNDVMFIWHASHGWIAKCKVTEKLRKPSQNEVDFWFDNFGKVGAVLPFELITEFQPEKWLSFPNFRQEKTGIKLNLFRKSISKISEDEAKKLEDFLSN